MENKPALTLLTVAAAAVIAAWIFFIEPAIHRSREYEGRITETSQSRRWGRTEYAYRHNPSDYNHYWHIERDDGILIKVSVQYRLWKEGEAGLRVKKVRGEKWPVIDTPEYREMQEERGQIREMIFGK